MKPLVVITGPTASGKSALALELAERYDAEIICADSRTIYKGMDIGTAKPTAMERQRVRHHLLDVVEPGEQFSVADFQRLTREAITDIRARDKVPFMVGGTGLYIDSVVLDYTFTKPQNEITTSLYQNELETKAISELQEMIKKQHLKMPINLKNKRHLIGTLTRGSVGSFRRKTPISNSYVVSITTGKDVLNQRIIKRADEMFESGVLEEAKILGQKYGWQCEAMTCNIYPILHDVLDGKLTPEQAKQRFIVRDRQLVKRQLTWLKRHDFVHWLSVDDARIAIERLLEQQ